VRLDHLLSKEHVQRSSVYRDANVASHLQRNPALSGWHASAGAHGWNIDIVAGDSFPVISTSRTCAGEEHHLGLVRSFARCWVLRDRASSGFASAGCGGFCSSGPAPVLPVAVFGPWCCVLFGVHGRGYRPYFENYTVDASILDTRIKSVRLS
jgi:hypothetical protein